MKEIAIVKTSETDKDELFVNDKFVIGIWDRKAAMEAAKNINESFNKIPEPKDVFVNAGIKDGDYKTVINRLFNGERFYTANGNMIFYDEKETFPFRFSIGNNESKELRLDLWDYLSTLKIKKTTEWYERITKPVPCVCKINRTNQTRIDLIVDYGPETFDRRFIGLVDNYCEATPASLDDIEIVGCR